MIKTIGEKYKKFACWIGWHSHPHFEPLSFDGCSMHSRCRWCKGEGMIDGQGNLFAVRYKNEPK